MKAFIVVFLVAFLCVVVEGLKCVRAVHDADPALSNTCDTGDNYCFVLTVNAKTEGAKIDASIAGCSKDLADMGIPANVAGCTQTGPKQLLDNGGVSVSINCCQKDSCNTLDGSDNGNGGGNGNGNGNSAVAPFTSYGLHIVLNFLKLVL